MVCVLFVHVCEILFLCYTLFDQNWKKKITMYSHEKSVGGNDRHCPHETSFLPCV